MHVDSVQDAGLHRKKSLNLLKLKQIWIVVTIKITFMINKIYN